MLLMTQFHTRRSKHRDSYILPVSDQIRSWHKANRKMRWGISKDEFDEIHPPPQLSGLDQDDGFNDFYDIPQLFCSTGVLGMGMGHVDRNYPLFGIPTIRFYSKSS